MTEKNPATLNLLAPTPAVTRISRLALLLMIGVVMAFLTVTWIAIHQYQSKNSADEAFFLSSETSATAEDQAWFKQYSDAVVLKPVLSITATEDKGEKGEEKENKEKNDATTTSSTEMPTGQKMDKIKADAYWQAITSPLSPPDTGVSADISSTTSMTSTPRNADILADAEAEKLPLTETQMAKLSHAFKGELGELASDPNLQSEKRQFSKNLHRKTDKDYLNETLKNPLSPFELQAGSVIPAVMNAGIDSDLPGQLTAIVRQNVYDSVTGRYLLIPQGSTLIILYDSHIAYGQQRVLPAVKRVIFPNGQSMDLEGMPASDTSGYAGFTDKINNHYARIYGSAIVMGGLSAAFQLSQPAQNANTDNVTATQISAGMMGQQLSQVATSHISKNLAIQPTLTIRPGYRFNVNVTADMIFPSPYKG